MRSVEREPFAGEAKYGFTLRGSRQARGHAGQDTIRYGCSSGSIAASNSSKDTVAKELA